MNQPIKTERELLPRDIQLPGTPGERSVIAAMDYTDKQVRRMFVENPSSQWIITPFEIIEREKFFATQST